MSIEYAAVSHRTASGQWDPPDPADCRVCGGAVVCEVGRKPDQLQRVHDRACPLRGRDGYVPPRPPRREWTDPAEDRRLRAIEIRGNPARLTMTQRRERLEHAHAMRAAGATYRAIGEHFGVGTPTVWHWFHPEPGRLGRWSRLTAA